MTRRMIFLKSKYFISRICFEFALLMMKIYQSDTSGKYWDKWNNIGWKYLNVCNFIEYRMTMEG